MITKIQQKWLARTGARLTIQNQAGHWVVTVAQFRMHTSSHSEEISTVRDGLDLGLTVDRAIQAAADRRPESWDPTNG